MLHCPTCGQEFAETVRVCPDDGTLLQADATVAMAAPADPLIGRTLDEKYRLDEHLGTGGMGTVYRATHLLIDRPVAIKVLNPRYVEDEAAQTRFRREARAAGRLQHANAVAVTDFGTTSDGLVYLVMELLEGRTLRDLLLREAPLDSARAVSFMLQISAAVGAAHDAGIIHRDLKPANIFIVQRKDAPPFVKVLDFGIAKLATEAVDDDDPQTITQVGAMIGTPRYMSPEQGEGAKLTPASDVYSLGVILYEMLTGTTPFTGSSPIAIAIKHASMPPRSPREFVVTIPPALEEVVMHALEKRQEDRPADANAFRSELYAVAERLGLEHAASNSAPSFESLRNAGKVTPSGRLVVDIERLRENRAATNAAQSASVISSLAEDGAQPSGDRDQTTRVTPMPFTPAPQPVPALAPVAPPVAPVASVAPAASVASPASLNAPPYHAPGHARFNISFTGKQPASGRRSKRFIAFLVIALVVLVAAALQITLMRAPQKLIAATSAGAALNRTTIFETGNGASDSSDAKKSGTRRDSRSEPRRTAHPTPTPKQSVGKRILNKIIHPF